MPLSFKQHGIKIEKPKLVCSPQLRYTKEAYANRVSGIALAKCVIDLDGRLCDCKILRSVPGMDEAILDALDMMRYSPVLYEGHLQRIQWVIPFRILPPPPTPTND